jgi:glutaryl-CoA dehydrogenase
MQSFRQLDSLPSTPSSEEERMVRDTVRACLRSAPALVLGTSRTGRSDGDGADLVQMGLFGPTIPHECRGAGLNNVAAGLIYQELARDSGLRSFRSVQSGSDVPDLRLRDESEERWLPKLASGEAIGCFGLTEPTPAATRAGR